MMHLQAVHLGFCFGYGAERTGMGIKTNSQRYFLRKQVPHFFWGQPFRLRRFPINEIKIGIFLILYRLACFLFCSQFFQDQSAIRLFHGIP